MVRRYVPTTPFYDDTTTVEVAFIHPSIILTTIVVIMILGHCYEWLLMQ